MKHKDYTARKHKILQYPGLSLQHSQLLYWACAPISRVESMDTDVPKLSFSTPLLKDLTQLTSHPYLLKIILFSLLPLKTCPNVMPIHSLPPVYFSLLENVRTTQYERHCFQYSLASYFILPMCHLPRSLRFKLWSFRFIVLFGARWDRPKGWWTFVISKWALALFCFCSTLLSLVWLPRVQVCILFLKNLSITAICHNLI